MMIQLYVKCRMNLKTTRTRLKALESQFKSSYSSWRNSNDQFIIKILTLLRSSLNLKQRRKNLRLSPKTSRKNLTKILDQDQGLEIEISLTLNLLLRIDLKNSNHQFHQVVFSKTFQKRKKENQRFRKRLKSRKSLQSKLQQHHLSLMH